MTQDKASCFQFGMPEAAIRTGSVDFVLPLSMIAHALTVLVMVAGGAKWFQVGKKPLFMRVGQKSMSANTCDGLRSKARQMARKLSILGRLVPRSMELI
ncbi:MAG: hypothetical protein JO185_07250 [Acidobacteriaceae bacterium]|nr:hypothetical protein [Acidobacteriaceae bacterium]